MKGDKILVATPAHGKAAALGAALRRVLSSLLPPLQMWGWRGLHHSHGAHSQCVSPPKSGPAKSFHASFSTSDITQTTKDHRRLRGDASGYRAG